MQKSTRRIPPLLGLVLLITSSHAAGPTSEEEAYLAYSWTRPPVVFSDDGNWRVHQNERGELVREPMYAASTPGQGIALNFPVLALATRGSAQQIWLLAKPNCLVELDFRAAKPKPKPLPGSDCPSSQEGFQGAAASYQGAALAVSPDGRWLAGGVGDSIRVLDLSNGQTRWQIPALHPLALQFEDEGRRLRLLDAQLGERWEGSADPSLLQLSRWDLDRGELSMTAERRGGFDQRAFLNAATRHHQLWLDSQGRLQALDLRTCPASPNHWPLPSGWEPWALSADPMGRWVAVALRQRAQFKLLWLNARDGTTLAETRLNATKGRQPYAVQAHAGGLLLREAQSPSASETDPEQRPVKPSAWQSVTLPTAVQALMSQPPDAQSGLAAAPCKDAAEQADARRIEARSLDTKPIWQRQLPVPDEVMPVEVQHCIPGLDHPARTWGVSPGGQLWMDAGAVLIRLSPNNGQELARWPTPRSAGICSTPSFARAEFLNWQGDTLSLRPFAAQLERAQRRLLDRRPGWQVESASWAGDLVLARWVRGGQAEQSLYQQQPAGGWRQVARRHGTRQEGATVFDGDDAGSDEPAWLQMLPTPLDAAALERQQHGVRDDELAAWRWTIGPMGTVQARHGAQLQLWHGTGLSAQGLSPLQAARMRYPSTGGIQLLGLGHGRALAWNDSIQAWELYEAAGPKRVWQGVKALGSRIDAWWWHEPKLWLVQHGGQLQALRLP